MARSAVQHAPHGRNVGVIATDGQRHVVLAGLATVCRIEIYPTARTIAAGQVDRGPGMRRIGTDQSRFARRRLCQQVAADIARRQAQGAKARDHDVRKILAHPLALRQRIDGRRIDFCAFGVVVEVLENTLHQVIGSLEHRPSGTETGARICRKIVVPWDVRRRENEVDRGVVSRALVIAEALPYLLPGEFASDEGVQRRDAGLHQAFSRDHEFVVGRFQCEKGACVSVQIKRFAALRGRRAHDQAVAQQLLRPGIARLQMRQVLCRFHRRRVVVAGLVSDVQQHEG